MSIPNILNEFEDKSWFTYLPQTDITEYKTLDAIIHQCNCFHVMGGGVAKALSQKWPQVLQADLLTIRGDQAKMGTFSCAWINDVDVDLLVFNLYSQFDFGCDKCQTSYQHLENGLYNIFNMFKRNKKVDRKWLIGIPWLIGCGLAGGDINQVLNIIYKTFKQTQLDDIATIVFCDIN